MFETHAMTILVKTMGCVPSMRIRTQSVFAQIISRDPRVPYRQATLVTPLHVEMEIAPFLVETLLYAFVRKAFLDQTVKINLPMFATPVLA